MGFVCLLACFVSCGRREREANSEAQPQRRRRRQNDIERGLVQTTTTTHRPQIQTREPSQQAVCSRHKVHIIVKLEGVIYGHEKIMQNRLGPSPYNTTCAICLDDFKDEDKCAVIKPCQHMYHKECIVTWLKLNQHCPYCRGSPSMERHLQILVSDQSSSS